MTGIWIALASAAASPICTVSFLLGPVQHGLAVKADDVDVLEAHPVLRGKGGHRLGMRQRDDPLGLAQAARPRIALRQVDGLVQRLAQQAALRFGIGPVSGRPQGA